MNAVALFVGFLAVGVPLSNYLGGLDVEADMATLSLYVFGILDAAASLVAFLAISSKCRRSPGVVLSVVTGAVAAATFYASLTLHRSGLGLWGSFSLGVVVSIIVASLSPIVGATARPNNRFERSRDP